MGKMQRKNSPGKKNLWIEIVYKQKIRTHKGKRHKERKIFLGTVITYLLI